MLVTPGRIAASIAVVLLAGGVVAAVAASRPDTATAEPVQHAAATMPATAALAPPVLTSEIPSPLTLEGVLSKIEASRLQINRLHVRGRTWPQLRHAGSDAWEDTIEYATGELWLERFPQLRYRRYFPDRVTAWKAGAAPFLRDKSEAVFDGTTGVWRSLAIAHHDGKRAGAWLTIPPQITTPNPAASLGPWAGVTGQESGLVLAPHLAPIDERGMDMIGRIRFATAPPAQWADKLQNLVEVVQENGRKLVHVRAKVIGYSHEEYWFDPEHGWICVRQEDRRGPKPVLLYENHVDEVTGSGAAWYPKARAAGVSQL